MVATAAVVVAGLAAGCAAPEPGGVGARLEPTPTSPQAAHVAADSDATLPDLRLRRLDSAEQVGLREFVAGRPAVLNIWASWCTPCRKEMPHFQQLYERAGDRLTVAGIDYDDPAPDSARALVAQLGLRYPQLVDREKRLRAPLRIAAVPVTVFVDADGKIVHVAFRQYESVEALTRDVRTYLDVEPGAGP
ncbi:MAG TPA: TlpA disulfide reductase family protein [Actinopolymorphaceae bacterium]|jgi:thiol-disulfide isomerase/thioredoxin